VQLGVQATHWPVLLLQVSSEGHVPQIPLQPSLPHCLPTQFGQQQVAQQLSHCPASLQVWPEGHRAQIPPQPSDPQLFPEQFGVHATQSPRALHACPVGQVPQLPPQPSDPHARIPQFGTQPASVPASAGVPESDLPASGGTSPPHAFATQCSLFAAQLAHVAPPVPHALSSSPSLHVPSLPQQPSQVVGPQVTTVSPVWQPAASVSHTAATSR